MIFSRFWVFKFKTSVADPGYPVRGRQHPTHMLFGENVCENERIGSRGGRRPPLDPPLDTIYLSIREVTKSTTGAWIN